MITFSENDIKKFKSILSKRLNQDRYYHSLCVADEAKRLAKKYGGNEELCYVAGLLHDITKNTSAEEHLQIFETFDIILDVIEKNAKKLWHAISGELYIKNYLKIENQELLDAVRYHTTANSDMTLTSKILYLADFTSADRTYDDVDAMRSLVEVSIEEAMLYALKYSINDLLESSKPVHPNTISAYNEISLKISGGK